jgi:protease-4
MSNTNPPALTRRQQFLVAALAALVVGAVLAPVVYGATDRPEGTVAVVPIQGPIVGPTAESVETELREIRGNESVEAVVLKLETPGGAPAASERMYTSVKRTAEEMPVVASVQGVSASGGYYAMLPAEDIYVLPTSVTGSVGLAAGAPRAVPPVEGPSGPDKRGSNQIQAWAQQDLLANVFIDTVMHERGDRIELSREGVAHADVYLGVRAVENGFADEIGDVDEAIEDAADRAGLDDYAVDARETGIEGLPGLFRTDDGVVVVYDERPGYGDVEPLEYAMVHEGSIPHVDTVRTLTDVEARAPANGTGAGPGSERRGGSTGTRGVASAVPTGGELP